MALTVRKALDCKKASPICLSLLILLLGAPTLLAQATAQTAQQANARIEQLAKLSQPRYGEIPIGAGDLLHVDVFGVPDLSQDIRVGETGMISFPLIPDRIDASGCSSFQLAQRIGNLLQSNGLVVHPQVSVLVKQQNSQPISVVGAVGHPIVYQEIRPTNLLEVLAQAGGIADDAGQSIFITRPSPPPDSCGKTLSGPAEDPPEKTQTITIRVSDLLQSGDPAFNIPLYGGDVVTVPRAGIVYAVGAFVQPGGYTLHDPGQTIDTLKLVALARGLSGTAKANDAVILRKDPRTGETKQIKVALKKIMDRKTPDVPLHANDVLVVPDSTSKKILARMLQAGFGIGTGVAVYRVGTQ